MEYPFVKAVSINMPRGSSVLGSIKSINKLIKVFKSTKFDLVQYSTPNASLYTAIASFVTRVPRRLYCQWGLVYVSMKGIKKPIFKAIEKLVCKLSTNIQPDSHGNLELCRNLGFYTEEKSNVIWNGSAKGIDLRKFDLDMKHEFSIEIKSLYNISNDDIVIGFVGRLGRDKGFNELMLAFQEIQKLKSNTKLLFVGPIEKEHTVKAELLKYFYENDDILKTGRIADVEKYYAAMDVFVLPSYREGFGMSVVEAQAMEIPVVVTNIPGPTNGMVNNHTGMIVELYNVDDIVHKVLKIIGNDSYKNTLGKNGRRFVEESFDSSIFIKKLIDNRISLIGSSKVN